MPNIGKTTIGAGAGSFGNVRAMTLVMPATAGMVLDSVSFGTGSGGLDSRVAVYVGGSASSPAGATLLWESAPLALASSGGWVTIAAGQQVIPSGARIWLVSKGNDFAWALHQDDGAAAPGDWYVGRWGTTVISAAPADAYPTTWPSETGAFAGGVTLSSYITYSTGGAGGGPQPVAPVVTVTRPSATSVAVPAGTELVLRATATASGGGDLSAGIVWTSSNAADGNAGGVPGRLGTGASITIDTAGWTGSRQIQAAATDANGTGTDAFTLNVGGAASGASPSTPELRTMCDLYHRDPDAARRRVPLYLTLADGSPAPAAGAKAKIIKNGGGAGDSNANVAAIANAGAGWFFVQLTAAEQDTPGSLAVAYDDGTARGRTLCAVLPLPAPVAGAVSGAASATALTLPAGLRLRAGWVLSITEGAGEGGSAVVDSYNSGTGAVVLEDPGLPVQPDATSRFTATASPVGATMPATDANGRVQAVGVDTLLARVPAEVATDADVQAIATTLGNGVTLALGQAAGIANAVLDQANGVETNMTPRQALRLVAAILGGAVSGAGTSAETFKAAGTNKVRATVSADPQGNRTLVLDLSA